MPAWGIVRAGQVELDEAEQHVADGLEVAVLVGADHGAVHLEVGLCRLRPGGTIRPLMHPFEESFYILEGNGVFAVADQAYRVTAGSYGFAPVGVVHSWSNESDAPLVWIRTRSPQPRTLGEARGTYPVAHGIPERRVESLDEPDPTRRYAGQFDEAMMPTPGPIQMRGFRSAGARNVAVWMLVDEVVGAVHHTLFSVRFDPTGQAMTLGGQHFHPFEETYYITEGHAVAHLEDESIEVGPGDLVFAGVNALHGFSNLGTDPVRWIEMQAPNPPPANAFFFKSDWDRPLHDT